MFDVLTPPQRDVVQTGLLETGFNCILQMPTGSGKTWLAQRSIASCLAAGHRAIYLAPTRALANELYERWLNDFAGHSLGIFTGDYGKPGSPYPQTFEQSQLMIMTPERLDACLRHWRSHWGWIPDVDLVVVDEFHLLGDGHRGARLEGVLMRLRRLNPFLRIIGLSATLGNREELADWLGGVEYSSDWRPVPLAWRTVRFRRADEKPHLLAEEAARVTQQGGKSLVFAQSRKRAEMLASHLRSLGHRATHHHAGLGLLERKQVEHGFRYHETEILVATATLEVGLNMPVRQVVLYDLQEFDGVDYQPLQTINVWQRAGRAGRYGLDTEGEALMFAPAWDGTSSAYPKGIFEPCESGLKNHHSLSEQIITEIASGLSRTRSELRVAMGESLAAHQASLPEIGRVVDEMCSAGLLNEVSPGEDTTRELRLKPTPLGYIAVRHMLSPASVLGFRKVFQEQAKFTWFDLLLIACSATDCEPVITVAFEELDELAEHLRRQSSHLLSQPADGLCSCLNVSRKRFLCGIKSALILRHWTTEGDQHAAALTFGCYPSEISRLMDSMSRILPGMAGTLQAIQSSSGEMPFGNPQIQARLRHLQTMVEAGLDENAATLTFVPGIGVKWAKRFASIGLHDLEDLAQADHELLTANLPLSETRAHKWIDEAMSRLSDEALLEIRDQWQEVEIDTADLGVSLDPYRLRRSLDLVVEQQDTQACRVSGGQDPHIVKNEPRGLTCDCPDHDKGNTCKHILAVRRSQKDPELLSAISRIDADMKTSINLTSLWMARHG